MRSVRVHPVSRLTWIGAASVSSAWLSDTWASLRVALRPTVGPGGRGLVGTPG